MKYLVTETTYFVDPHGSPDEGGVRKFVTDEECYKFVDGEDYFHGGPRNRPEGMSDDDYRAYIKEDATSEDDLYGSEDGYNCEMVAYSCKEITDEQAADFQSIIDMYNAL